MPKFARDVLINVLANIVATWVLSVGAAAIYLLGWWAGLFPDIQSLVAVSTYILALSAAVLVVPIAAVAHLLKKPRVASIALVVGLPATFAYVGQVVVTMISDGRLVAVLALAALEVLVACALVAQVRVLRRPAARASTAPPDSWSPDPRAYL